MLKMCGFILSCTCAKSHPGICSPWKHSTLSNDSVCGHRRPFKECADTQADLGFRCPHMLEDALWRGPYITIHVKPHLTLVMLNKVRCYARFWFPANQITWSGFFDRNSHFQWQTVQIQISWLQKPTDLDLHCLLRQDMLCSARERKPHLNLIMTRHKSWYTDP